MSDRSAAETASAELGRTATTITTSAASPVSGTVIQAIAGKARTFRTTCD